MAILPGQWHLTLLGELRAEQNHSKLTRFRSQKTAVLLAYLAYHLDRAHPRDLLADLLWPEDDPDAARGSLRTALNSLRKQLEPPGFPRYSVLEADRSFIRLRSDAVTTDVAAFNSALQEARRAATAQEKAACLTRALHSYQGELLPGFYEDWILTARRALEEAYAATLRQLMVYAEGAGDLSHALEYAVRAVEIDPTAEEAHVEVIRLFRKAGRPREALQQYDALERILHKQFDAAPTEATRSLVESLRGTLSRPVTALRSRRHIRPAPTSDKARTPLRREAMPPAASLPLPLMPLFGRDTDIDRLTALLQPGARAGRPSDPSVRLMTLLGPGGSGKTRLAIEVARRLQRAFQDAAWFVSLAELSEPTAIPDAVLDAMALSRSMNAPWTAPIRGALGDRSGLLILDNFEHLAERGFPYIQELLAHLPGLTCVTTSRVRLDLEGERLFAVAPLTVPAKALAGPEAALEYPSVRLFVDRAQAARADFQLTASNTGAVAELCRRLEGLPLALELAASWAQTITPHQMLERLRTPLALSARGKRDGVSRHGSLRAAVEWSYRLLSPELQALFRRLSVFRGGWNLAAAIAVCAEESAPHESEATETEVATAKFALEEGLLQNLASLAAASLVSTEEITLESGPEIRFFLLETLREYGAELLCGEEAAVLRERHAAYFCRQAEIYAAHEHGYHNRDRLDPDYENLRTALRWSADTPGHSEQALRMTIAMFEPWIWWGHKAEAREWVERFLSSAPPGSPLQADALNAAGNLCYYMDDAEAAGDYQRRHLELRRALDDPLGIAKALSNSGNALMLQGRYAEARALHEESCVILARLNDSRFLPAALLNLAESVNGAGEHARSRELYWEALRKFEEIGHRSGVAQCCRSLGLLEKERGDYRAALEMLERSLHIFRALGSRNIENIQADLASVQELLNGSQPAAE